MTRGLSEIRFNKYKTDNNTREINPETSKNGTLINSEIDLFKK
jgi:hypothetical protein